MVLLPDQFEDESFHDSEKNIKGSWMLKANFTEQIVFDHRSAVSKALHKQFKSLTTFKGELDIWEDKPHVVASEEVKSEGSAQTVVHYLSDHHQFVYIISIKTLARFLFYKHPFKTASQELQVTTTYDRIRTVVAIKQGLHGDHSGNSFIVVAYGESNEDVTLVRLNFVQERNEWKTTLKRKDSSGSGAFVNVFHLKGD